MSSGRSRLLIRATQVTTFSVPSTGEFLAQISTVRMPIDNMVVDPSLIIEVVSDCYKVGKKIVEIVETWKAADEEVRSRVVTVEWAWTKSQMQIDYLRRVAQVIDNTLYSNFEDLLGELYRCLSNAVSKLQSIDKKERIRRLAPTFLSFRGKAEYIWKKKALDETIADIETWMKRFDPSWFLTMKIADPMIDKELTEARMSSNSSGESVAGLPSVANDPLAAAASLRVTLTSNGSHHKSMGLPEACMETRAIAHSEACFGRLTGDSKWYLVDSILTAHAADTLALKRNVRTLAFKLSQADPVAFGLLSCKGVMPVTANGPNSEHKSHIVSLQMVFRIPPGMDSLRSLRDLLLSSYHISITQRLRIACGLAKSIAYVHTFGFVHKSVRPESVLSFEDVPGDQTHIFLLGFDSFRAADGATNYHGDMHWERNLYRHPERQGAWASEKYNMRHDIYSLGICLLEVGLWQSFVTYNAEIKGHNFQPTPGPWYPDFQNWLNIWQEHATPKTVKEFLVKLARERLPSRMGERYAKVVIRCLTCLDDEELMDYSQRDHSVDHDMIVAVDFVEQTISALTEILA